MRIAKQASIILGLVTGIVGLIFLLFPGLRPGQDSGGATSQSASMSGIVTNGRTTQGQFLDYSDRSKLGYTKDQLALPGASAFVNVRLVGYRGKTLTFERQVVDSNGDVLPGTARDFKVTPPLQDVTHPWFDWIPLPPGTGSYAMVIKVMDVDGKSAITCAESDAFGGLAGFPPGGADAAKPPKLCAGG
ncbi:MAG TPA: hypothetical protein VFD90_07240 [Gaiellales bacterium]|nr:hypothetical protein [Gaiellales bacterium]